MTATASFPRARRRPLTGTLAGLRARPELAGLVAVAAVLNFWNLSINGWANTFYSGAVRSMAGSWHDFLFASLDSSGLMTVDKPPAALWVQALSVRIFGFHPLAILIPQALMGVAAVVLCYDLVRRRFGRAAGVAGGLALALTPISVAIARHNNPDQLLILCCVAALWFAVRALEDGRTRWLVLSGAAIGLGFETKMAVALFVVPGIALAYAWVAPRGYVRSFVQLLWGGLSLAVVGLAWPVLVTLWPASDRPWISGTSDNSIWSLIVNYNGVGRVAGQTGTPGGGGGGGGGFGGGSTGIFRLLDSGLGGQAGWLLGGALAAGIALIVLTRLRRADPRTGWLVAVGGAFLVTAVVFSFASGIFHPYYVSFLAPWTALLIGAGVGVALGDGRAARIAGPAILLAGALVEVIVVAKLGGSVSWSVPLVIVACGLAAAVLALRGRSAGAVGGVQLGGARVRGVAVAVALAALLAAPAAWAADTLGYATSETFPSGGPAGQAMGGPGGFGRHGGFGGRGGFGARGGMTPPGATGATGATGSAGATGATGSAGVPPGAQGQVGPPGTSGAGGSAGVPGATQGGSAVPAPGAQAGSGQQSPTIPGSSTGQAGSTTRSGFGGGAGGPGAGGGMFGGDSTSLKAASAYAAAHGGGTIGVESQSSAAAAIVDSDANVAGLGGFSGRESTVSVGWLAMEVSSGKLRWLLADSSGAAGAGAGGSTARGGTATGFPAIGAGGAGGFGGDSRQGSTAAISIAEKVGRKVTVTANGTTVTMYDLQGKAAAILAAAT